MNTGSVSTRIVFGLVLSMAICSSMLAQSQRTFVSAQRGSDNNSCTLSAPCLSFSRALTQVASGGEIVALDSGGYAPVTVNKAVTIEANDGVYAGVTVSVLGISVSAGASDVVILRGLTIQGQGPAAYGITLNSAKELRIEHCSVSGFTRAAINFAGSGHLFLQDTTANSSNIGMLLQPTSSSATAVLDHCRAEGNDVFGFIVVGGVATVRNSVFSGNEQGAVVSGRGDGTTAELNMENCVASNNGDSGILVSNPGGTLRVSNCTVTDNNFGIDQQNSGIALSRGNNTIEGNHRDINGTVGAYSPK